MDCEGSKNMAWNKSLLFEFKTYGGGVVPFRNDEKGSVFISGKVEAGKLNFDNVNLVDKLKFNLLNVYKMCDKG